jgi:2'-5' RNA ligase
MERSVLIFPKLATIDAVTAVRRNYDPLAQNIRPHISLIFPFDSPVADAVLMTAVADVIQKTPAFSVDFATIAGDYANGYFWLAATSGAEQLTALHDQLYALPYFKDYQRTDIPYQPHITLGHVAPDEASTIVAALDCATLTTRTAINEVAIERILSNGDSAVFANLRMQ